MSSDHRFYALDPLHRDTHLEDKPTWVSRTLDSFVEMIIAKSPPFPCYFAPAALKNSGLYYSYVEASEIATPTHLLAALTAFVSKIHVTPQYAALVIFAELGTKSINLELAERRFWSIIQFLLDNDPSPWPSDHVSDPNDIDWEFCFAGIPWFINGHSSAYRLRKSRSSPCDLMIVIQPSSNIRRLRADTQRVCAISDQIRSNVIRYDGMPISSVFGGSFADNLTYNWRQFWLNDDDNQAEKMQCPLIIGRK